MAKQIGLMVKNLPDPQVEVSNCCGRGWLVARVNGEFRVAQTQFVAPRDPSNPKARAAIVVHGFKRVRCPGCFEPLANVSLTPWTFGEEPSLDQWFRQVAREVKAEHPAPAEAAQAEEEPKA